MAAMPYGQGDVVKVEVLLLIDGTDIPTKAGEFHITVKHTATADEAAEIVGADATRPDGAIAIDQNEVVAGMISVARSLRQVEGR
jgi:hypothetical protein